MPEGMQKIGGIAVEVTAEYDSSSDAALSKAGEKSAKKWSDSFVKSTKTGLPTGLAGSLSKAIENFSYTKPGQKLFGRQTYNVQNQPTGFQGGMFSGAANKGIAGIGKSLSSMVLKLGLIAGGLGLAVGFLGEMSPALKQQERMFGSAMKLFFRPFGDALASLFRPFVMSFLKWMIAWNKLTKTGWDTPEQAKEAKEKYEQNLRDWENFKEKVIGIVGGIVQWVNKNFTLNKIIEILGGVWTAFGWLGEQITGWLGSTWSTITDPLQKPLRSFFDWLGATWTAVTEAIISPLRDAYNGIVDYINSIKPGTMERWEAEKKTTTAAVPIDLTGGEPAYRGAEPTTPETYTWTEPAPAEGSHPTGNILFPDGTTAEDYYYNPATGTYDYRPPAPATTGGGGGGGGTTYNPPVGLDLTAEGGGAATTYVPIAEENVGETYTWSEPMAEGGIVMKPTKAIIGEGDEPEAVMPLSYLKNLMGGNTDNFKTPMFNRGDIKNNFDITVNITAHDKYQIISEVTRKLTDELQRRLSIMGG